MHFCRDAEVVKVSSIAAVCHSDPGRKRSCMHMLLSLKSCSQAHEDGQSAVSSMAALWPLGLPGAGLGVSIWFSIAICLCRDVEVVKVQQYGCFVALNSQVQALVHVSELAVERVSDPASLFQAGDRIDVKVLDKNKRGQLQLSRQENC